MNKNQFFILLLSSCSLLFLVNACTPEQPSEPTDLTQSILIPQPTSVRATGEKLKLKKGLSILVADSDSSLQKAAKLLSNQLSEVLGFAVGVAENNEQKGKGNIILSLDKNGILGAEGYQLDITKKHLKISANEPAGAFYGMQTLLQLLPAEHQPDSLIYLATGTIKDQPGYTYRGSMLDVCRHFFSVADVKRYIDFLAALKMNVLHLHLTEDQGWRIEIKKWPNLTTHGGSTEVGGGPGGFYTQEEYKDIVSYAADRFITIIPEIDMPGHTNAALASYAELNCDGVARKLYTGTKVGFSSFCTDKEITYQFITDVIAELAAMTPGPYIHIGGDETLVTKEKDFIKFIDRVKGIVEAHGKQMIGWDETAQAALDSTALVQLWNSPEYAREAVSKGAKIIMSPATKAYLDMQYDSTTKLGLHWAAYIEVDSAYLWDPAKLIQGVQQKNIVGVEAPLWTETITNMDELEYMVFPRLLGIAEIAWTPAEQRSWESYKNRLAAYGKRLKAMNIDFYQSSKIDWK